MRDTRKVRDLIQEVKPSSDSNTMKRQLKRRSMK
jgi:hypothetical protein